jgi:hypothetical protein
MAAPVRNILDKLCTAVRRGTFCSNSNWEQSRFSGLVVSMLPSGTQDRGLKSGRSRRIFFGRKNPQHAFLRKGSKAVRPVSQICGTKKNPVGLRGIRISQAKLFGHFTLEVPSFANRGLQRSSRFGALCRGAPTLHSSSMGALCS